MMLNIFQTFFDNFIKRIQMPQIIVALSLAVVGLSLAILGRRVARVVRKSDDIADNDPVLITFKAIGLVCLFVAVLIIIFRAGV